MPSCCWIQNHYVLLKPLQPKDGVPSQCANASDHRSVWVLPRTAMERKLKEFYSTWLDVIDVIVILWHSCQILHVPMSAYLVGDQCFGILHVIIGLVSVKLCETPFDSCQNHPTLQVTSTQMQRFLQSIVWI